MRTPFIKLHISILLAGFTGIFGKLITLAEGPLVWYRMLVTAILFGTYLLSGGNRPRVSHKDKLRIGGVGLLLASHWILFYASIKYANVSVGVVCFSLVGIFTAFLEPIAYRRRLSLRETLLGMLSVAGVLLIFHFDARFRTGIALGVGSSLLAALFTIFNKKVGEEQASTTMLFYEMTGGFVFLSLLAPAYLHIFPETRLLPDARDAVFLLLLASFCTIGLYLLQIQALRDISPFTVNLSYNLEPMYSILLAMLLFGEANELGASFYGGLGLICLSVALQTFTVLFGKNRVRQIAAGTFPPKEGRQ